MIWRRRLLVWLAVAAALVGAPALAALAAEAPQAVHLTRIEMAIQPRDPLYHPRP